MPDMRDVTARENEMILPSVIEVKDGYELFSTSPPNTHTHTKIID